MCKIHGGVEENRVNFPVSGTVIKCICSLSLTWLLNLQSLNAQSRALLMQKLDRSGTASRFPYFLLLISVFAVCFHSFIFH